MTKAVRAAWMYGLLLLLCGGIFLLSAQAAHAQGLVQCGIGSTLAEKVSCQFCDLFKLVNSIIRYLILAGISIAAVLFTYAGFLYFTSGGNTEKAGKGKTIFVDVVVGLVLALVSFLIIDTLLNTLASGYLKGPSWNTVDCVSNRNLFGEVEYQLPEGEIAPGGGGGGNVNPQVTNGNCSAAALAETWGSNAQRMSCIIAGESSCVDDRLSGVDRMSDGRAFSTGRYQINVTANQMRCPGGVTLNCPSAFTGRNNQAVVKDESLYQECISAANNVNCATLTAQNIASTQGFGAWTANRNCN